MAVKWKATRFPGVRFYEHSNRKHGVQRDRYFSIRYQRDKRRREEGLGWSSEGWTAEKASNELAALKKAHTLGEGPVRLLEKRELSEKNKAAQKAHRQQEERENITFADFFKNTYYPISQTNKKTESYRKEKEHFKNWLKPVLGNMALRKIYPLHLERVKKNMLDAGRSPRSIQYVFATFRQVWNMAKRDKIVQAESPTKSVTLPRVSNQRERFLSHEEAEALLSYLKGQSLQLHNITLLSLHCGLRASEIFRLKWGDVELERGVITVHGKGNKSRPAFMTDRVKTMFQDLNPGKPNSLVFPDRNGKKIVKISNAFDRAVNELGLNDGVSDRLKRFTFHCCRHTFASWLVIGGENLYTVQKLLGHSSFLMTERYSHLSPGVLENAIRNLEKTIKKPKSDIKVVSMKKKP